MEIETERLLLRQFRDDDLPNLAEINADPTVMEFIGSPLTEDQSLRMIENSRQSWNENGFGKFAVEVPGVTGCIGYIGLGFPRFQSHFTPCVEIGWRLSSRYWDHGFATEGATAVRDFAFDNLGLGEIVSFTTVQNYRSRRVMEKIGLTRDIEDDFDHPNLSKDSPLLAHVLYRGIRGS